MRARPRNLAGFERRPAPKLGPPAPGIDSRHLPEYSEGDAVEKKLSPAQARRLMGAMLAVEKSAEEIRADNPFGQIDHHLDAASSFITGGRGVSVNPALAQAHATLAVALMLRRKLDG